MQNDLIEATVAVLREAETKLPIWVVKLIEKASEKESNPVARSQLKTILDNAEIARTDKIPICQDTGLSIFHVEIGSDLKIDFDIKDAIAKGVRIATKEIPLRPNAVDPFTRINTGDNTGKGMPHIIMDIAGGDALRITAFPKGAGSENMSVLEMINPADDAMDFVLRAVAERGGMACPPLFVGVGIGGTFDLAPQLAKRALFNMPGASPMELDLLERINALGLGPMGLGGDTTVLGVKIESACCHTASLPVAVNLQCWANRKATATVREDGWSLD